MMLRRFEDYNILIYLFKNYFSIHDAILRWLAAIEGPQIYRTRRDSHKKLFKVILATVSLTVATKEIS